MPLRTGCVMTMLTGSCAGQSTHIVGRTLPGSQMLYQAVAFPRGTPQPNDQYVINSVPFSGTGFGYLPITGSLNATDTAGRSIALLPNYPLTNNPPSSATDPFQGRQNPPGGRQFRLHGP